MSLNFAVLIDAGFLRIRAREWAQRFNKPADDVYSLIPEFTSVIPNHPQLQEYLLYRVFYYDGNPFASKEKVPLGGDFKDFGNTNEFHKGRQLLEQLGNMPHVAVRLGETKFRGWQIKHKRFSSECEIVVRADDLQPHVEQKGVDMRIGLDIAALSLKQFVDVVVLVSGDSDFVPALKFARTEGRQVVLFTLGHKVTRELKAHADVCVEETLSDIIRS